MDHHRRLGRRKNDHVNSFINLVLLSFVSVHNRTCSTPRLLFGAQLGATLSSEWRTCRLDHNGSSCETHRLSADGVFIRNGEPSKTPHLHRKSLRSRPMSSKVLWLILDSGQGARLTPDNMNINASVQSIGFGSRQLFTKWIQFGTWRVCCYKVKPMHIVWWISYSCCISFDVDPCIYKDWWRVLDSDGKLSALFPSMMFSQWHFAWPLYDSAGMVSDPTSNSYNWRTSTFIWWRSLWSYHRNIRAHIRIYYVDLRALCNVLVANAFLGGISRWLSQVDPSTKVSMGWQQRKKISTSVNSA